MQPPQTHDIGALFAQLGLSSDPQDIERFIAEHAPLPEGVLLHKAPFWTPAQASFLKDGVLENADWAEAIDDLNVRLHRGQAN